MERIALSENLELSRIVYGMWRIGDDADTSPAHVQAKIEACLAQIAGLVVSGKEDAPPSPVTLMAAEAGLQIRDLQVSQRRLQFAVVADNLGVGAAGPAARLLRRLSGHTVPTFPR